MPCKLSRIVSVKLISRDKNYYIQLDSHKFYMKCRIFMYLDPVLEIVLYHLNYLEKKLYFQYLTFGCREMGMFLPRLSDFDEGAHLTYFTSYVKSFISLLNLSTSVFFFFKQSHG